MTLSSIRISDQQFNVAIQELGALVAIPSISDSKNALYDRKNLDLVAERIQRALVALDFKVQLEKVDDSAPFVVAERITDPAKPTILLYSHYDVQPVDAKEWNTDPFVMVEKQGRLYGRGASDDKAGIVAILTALQAFKEQGQPLPVNVRILFEGEEEIGSPHLGALIKQQAARLSANALVILDGMNKDVHSGTLSTATRGFIGLCLKIQALEKPVHSGIGCLLPDPVMALAHVVSTLSEPMKIPGIMDGYQELTGDERTAFRSSSETAEEYMKKSGVLQPEKSTLSGDAQTSIYERMLETPTISVVNFNAGVVNGSYAIQAEAMCTVNIRTLHGQDSDHIAHKVTEYLRSQKVLWNLELQIEQDGSNSWAWKGDLKQPFTKKYMRMLQECFAPAVAMPSGGALQPLEDFSREFPQMEMIIPAVEDPQTQAHSHNESQDIAVFRKATDSLIAFLDEAGK